MNVNDAGDGSLMTWVHGSGQRVPRQRGEPQVDSRLRFAFYGRISTDGYQDADTSRAWQRCAAVEFLAGRGMIVAEYFDIGQSRLEVYERAFCGNLLLPLMPVLERLGVQLWLPELDGPFQPPIWSTGPRFVPWA